MSVKDKISKLIDEDDPQLSAMLGQLQGNILKGHGRRTTINRFLCFDPARGPEAREAIARLARGGFITSAARQAALTRLARDGGPRDLPVAFLMISASGLEKLGLPQALWPEDEAYRAGMGTRALGDADPGGWDGHLSKPDALLLVAADAPSTAEAAAGAKDPAGTMTATEKAAAQAAVDAAADEALAMLRAHADQLSAGFADAGIAVMGDEPGRARFNHFGEGIEHFGYVDGRSQPLLTVSDAQKEIVEGVDRWNPVFRPDQVVLVPCPGMEQDEECWGSYFVFRKLEQNVKAFKAAEEALGDLIAAQGGDRESAGAMIVGRFEDGTPFIDSGAPLGAAPPNNFDYRDDVDGGTCPFGAHIRKTNPRGDVARQFGLPNADGDRQPIMARRGIPYGDRTDDPNDDDQPKPEGGVGLLFMAYQRSIVDQFEFTQKSWANNEDFLRNGGTPTGRVGIDPIIGQFTPSAGQAAPFNQNWPVSRGGAGVVANHVGGFVAMKGGEYFFAPPLRWLAMLPTMAEVMVEEMA